MNQSLLMGKNFFSLKNGLRFHSKKPRLLLLFISCLFSLFGFAQQKVTGRVVSGDSAIVGATVNLKGSTVSTVTDATGSFTIDVPANSTLVISYVGFVEQEVKVANRTSITITLRRADEQMGEVIVVGYGTQRKSTLTGSVSQVAGTEV